MKKSWMIAGILVGMAIFPSAIPPLLGILGLALPAYILWVVFTEGAPGPTPRQLWLLNRCLPEGQKVGPDDKPPANWRTIVTNEEIKISRDIVREADVLFSHGSSAWHQYVDREVMLAEYRMEREDARTTEIRSAADALFHRDSQEWHLYVAKAENSEAEKWLEDWLKTEPDGPLRRQILDLQRQDSSTSSADNQDRLT